MTMTPARLSEYHEHEAVARQGHARHSDARIDVPYERIADFCRRYNLAWLALFGSVIRDDFMPESDVDVLVDFLPDLPLPGLKFYWDMPNELSEMFGGRKVDLHTPDSLSKYFVQEVLEEAEVVYVA